MLSLAGVKPTKQMQGKALFGKYADREERKMQFAIAANQLHHFMPVRAASDRRYKYIRSYLPYRQFALRNYYQWGMPGNKAWDKLVLGGHNTNPVWALPFESHPAEMLFDLQNDPGETHNLATDPAYAGKLLEMRAALSEHIRSTADLGFFLPTSRHDAILYNKVRDEQYPLEELHALAEKAGNATPDDLPALTTHLASHLKEMRYWALVGMAKLAREGQVKECPEAVRKLMDDADPYIAAEAAYAAAYMGAEEEAVAQLVTPAREEYRKIGYSALECLSLDRSKHEAIRRQLPLLKQAAETLPRVQNEDAGLMARGILVNLDELDIKLLHGEEAYQKGLKFNHGRRAMLPKPY